MDPNDTTHIYAPSAFIPNGDGINDVFQASITPSPREILITIINDTGTVVFQSTDPAAFWDGGVVNCLVCPASGIGGNGRYREEINGTTAPGFTFVYSGSLCLANYDPDTCTEGEKYDMPGTCIFPDQIDPIKGVVHTTADRFCESR